MVLQSVRPTDSEIERVVDTYGNTLFKICFVILCNKYDAEDAVQDTIIKYMNKAPSFNDSEHEKAWLITVATNRCKNIRRFSFMHNHINIDDLQEFCKDDEKTALLDLLLQLPDKHKTVLYLHYIEEYKVNSIADMLGITPSAVKKRLQKGRSLLKEKYRKENQDGF
ncbi:MAG: RNA polymerase sigma factor [Eubacteriales bacterium]